MKKSVFCFFIINFLIAIMLVSCRAPLQADKMLLYQNESEHDIVLTLGEYKYPMHLSFSAGRENAPRDGRATMAGGVLEGVEFEMQSGALKMQVGELEYMLDKSDCDLLYALFSSFAIKEDEFIGVTSEEGSGILEARFDGLYEYTLFLNESDYTPVKIMAETDAGLCTVEFENKESSQKAE